MKSNILIKGLAALFVVVLVVVMVKARNGKNEAANNTTNDLLTIENGPTEEDNGLMIDPLDDDYLKEEYGVDVDSPVETMRTLTNETKAVREDSLKLQQENMKLKQQVQQLLKMEESLNRRVNSRFSNAEKAAQEKQKELNHTQGLTQNLISKLEDKIDTLQNDGKKKRGKNSAQGYDIGDAGIPNGLGYDDNGTQINYDEVIWVNPIDASVDSRDPTKIELPDFSEAKKMLPEVAQETIQSETKKKQDRLVKAYTIPANATLLGSVSFTAMLGRIPTNGQVVDPYPFKVIVGEENLSSNGIKIPGVAGIKMTGIAKGDWVLSCVSGEIRSMTFTFHDGTIVTIPEPGTKAGEPLAWFSDRNGVPCITGKRITNAVSYLSQRVGLTTASSYANAEAAGQFTTSTNNNGGLTSGLTGDAKVFAKNTAIAEGINEATDWLDARQSSSFDAIYVKPNTELAIHITEELKIDYDPEGRKVNHYANINRLSDTQLD